MEIKTYSNALSFLADAEKVLVKDEAKYGRILVVARTAIRMPHMFKPENIWFCTVHTGHNLNAVAAGGRNLGEALIEPLTGDKRVLAEILVTAISRRLDKVTVVMGEKELADGFAVLWGREKKVKILSTMQSRLFRLEKVNDVLVSPGKLRMAAMADIELVKKWSHAFSVDIQGGREFNMPEPDVAPAIDNQGVFFWEVDGNPVSMAFRGGETERGITINHVYTPPEWRGKGYATSCVAELSRMCLQSGKEFCMLTTDLANPTSNSIYTKIGYKPVWDTAWHSFG
jgi:uncharacterized protein